MAIEGCTSIKKETFDFDVGHWTGWVENNNRTGTNFPVKRGGFLTKDGNKIAAGGTEPGSHERCSDQ